MWSVRIWLMKGERVADIDYEEHFSTHDEAWVRMNQLLSRGVMCDTIRR